MAAERPIQVLTLSPFYPSREDSAQGCFVAEPLAWTEQLGVKNEVLAVQPLHRGAVHEVKSEIAAQWQRYMCLPGNIGLPSAGLFLAEQLKRRVRSLQASRRLDLIHAHAALPCGHAAMLIAEDMGIPYVVTVHGFDAFFDRQAGVAGALCKTIARRVYESAAAVICISEAVRKVISEVRKDVKVIYNGVDPAFFRPGAERNPLAVLSVGNLIPIKGHARLLHAFARVRGTFPACELQIIGDGPELRKLQDLAASLGISSRVHFLGRKSRTEVAHAMHNCAIFALPSEYEGLGCVYLEAMACGKPVIGCHGQGIAEIVENGKTGILVSPRSEAELAEALRMLLHSADLRQRLGTAARLAVLDRCTLAYQARQLAGAYRECVA